MQTIATASCSPTLPRDFELLDLGSLITSQPGMSGFSDF
jgi:hypothetical protein